MCETGGVRRWLLLAPLVLLAWAGSAAAATSPLEGVYETTIKGQATVLNGIWLISFAGNGTYAVVKAPNTRTLLIGGTSAVSGKSVLLHDKAGPLACAGAGKYSWIRKGKTLRLKKVKDACSGRVAVLATAAYTKVG
jgi:hypothetical protein